MRNQDTRRGFDGLSVKKERKNSKIQRKSGVKRKKELNQFIEKRKKKSKRKLKLDVSEIRRENLGIGEYNADTSPTVLCVTTFLLLLHPNIFTFSLYKNTIYASNILFSIFYFLFSIC